MCAQFLFLWASRSRGSARTTLYERVFRRDIRGTDRGPLTCGTGVQGRGYAPKCLNHKAVHSNDSQPPRTYSQQRNPNFRKSDNDRSYTAGNRIYSPPAAAPLSTCGVNAIKKRGLSSTSHIVVAMDKTNHHHAA